MITDKELEAKEAEIGEFFGFVEDCPKNAAEPTRDDERRIEQIMGRVRFEALMKETTSFVFNSFGATMSGVVHAMFGVFPNAETTSDTEDPDNQETYL